MTGDLEADREPEEPEEPAVDDGDGPAAAAQRTDGEEGYVHRPGHGAGMTEDAGWRHPDAVEREFDWRGWVLVAVMGFAFVIAPLAVYVIATNAGAGLPWRLTLVALPLVPALLLGVVAVWATTRP